MLDVKIVHAVCDLNGMTGTCPDLRQNKSYAKIDPRDNQTQKQTKQLKQKQMYKLSDCMVYDMYANK